MIALSVIIIKLTSAVSSLAPLSPFAAHFSSSTTALAFHIQTQSGNISQAQRTAQDVDSYLNDTHQAIQSGNTTRALSW